MADLRWWAWALVSLLVACVIGLIIWARGAEHHHGQDVGALSAPYGVARTWGG